MKITIVKGTGVGVTPLAAFDAALLDAGVPNYNLIALSSVIPAGTTVERGKYQSDPADYGDRLYVVLACQKTVQPGEMAWAGLGWVQEPETGRGLLAELHGNSKSVVQQDIYLTLSQMVASRPDLAAGPIESELIGILCEDQPVCALVLAVYVNQKWA
jgi:arginine decarboxylase